MRRKEEERLERERRKAEKEAERQRQIDEERQREEAAAAAAVAAEAAAAEAKKQRAADKKSMQRERARLRRVCGVTAVDPASAGAAEAGAAAGLVDAESVEHLCSNLGLEALQQLCNQLASADLDADAKLAALDVQLDSVMTAAQREQAARDAATLAAAASLRDQAKKEKQQIKAKLEEWSEEEVGAGGLMWGWMGRAG